MEKNPLQPCGSVVQKKKIKVAECYNNNNNEDDDRMSELPEDILEKIFLLLPLKDAVATSTLSKRWRFVWTFTKNLDFDAQEIFNRFDSKNYSKLIKHERPNYIQWVNSVITQRNRTNNMVGGIDLFRIDFDLHHKFSSSIDEWIKFAVKNRVQILELDLFADGLLIWKSDCYILRQELFDPVAVSSLRVLNLTSVDISGEVVEWLLSMCPLLERLQIIDSSDLINLRVVGGPLKYLEINECLEMEKVEIFDAQNLVSLYCWSSTDDYQFRLENVPKLVDLSFDMLDTNLSHTLNLLSFCLSQLQILQLDLSCKDPVMDLVYPTLTNLKQLKLILNARENLNLLLSIIIPFLKVSPSLQKLKLMMQLEDYVSKVDEFTMEPTNCPLKEVEILGYSGLPDEDQLVIYFAENLVALQKIIVDPSKFHIDLACRRTKDNETIGEEEKVRGQAVQHIKEKLPTTIEFVCL